MLKKAGYKRTGECWISRESYAETFGTAYGPEGGGTTGGGDGTEGESEPNEGDKFYIRMNCSSGHSNNISSEDIKKTLETRGGCPTVRMGFPAGDKEALTAAVKEICGWIDTAGPKKMIVQLVGDLSPIEAWNISEEM